MLPPASLPSVTEERFSSLSSNRLTTLPSANLPQYLLTFNIIYIFNIFYGDEKERTPRRCGVWVGSDFVLEKVLGGVREGCWLSKGRDRRGPLTHFRRDKLSSLKCLLINFDKFL